MNISLDATLDALTHLICSDRERYTYPNKTLIRHHQVLPAYFDGFEVLDENDSDDFILAGSNASDLPVWPLDVCVGGPETSEGWEPGSWQFTRMRTLNTKEWRGKLSVYSPRMIELARLTSRPNGNHMTFRLPYAIMGRNVRLAAGFITNFRIHGLGEFGVDPGAFGDKAHDTEVALRILKVAAGLSLRRYYLWSVLLGEGDGPRARFVTDPIGVREAFRLRDIPPGKKRRAALLHWVKAHWRKSRKTSAADRAWIRAHLRGVWSYTWNGLICQIEPSIEDMDMLTAAA